MGIDWIYALVLLLGGGAVGVIVGRLFWADSGREKRLKEELEKAQKEFADYRSEVEAHFRETAEAVNEMTESYRRVHEKLRDGASRLCGESGPLLGLTPSPRLEQSPSSAGEETAAPASDAPAPQAEATPPAASESAEQSAAVSGDEDAESPAPPTVEQSAQETENEPLPEESAAAGEGVREEESEEAPTVTQPLDYAVDGEEEERDKTLH